MFGKNKILPIIKGDGSHLDIVKIFKTIQGEGIYAGKPAIFIRLGGCNLKCKFCDTEFDKFTALSLKDILSSVERESKKNKISLIVITGGEPLRQPIEKLCKLLLKNNFVVQIETNGTIKRKLPRKVHIACSPKISKGKYQINNSLTDYVDSFKFIVSKQDKNYKSVPSINIKKPIYVQPMDNYDKKLNQENTLHAMKLAYQNDYILSLQQHKILDIE